MKGQLVRGTLAAMMLAGVMLPLASRVEAGNETYRAGLVTLCYTDSFVRVGGLNESPLDVTISAVETGSNGKPVDLLGNNASDELRAIFPITIPANSKYVVQWELAIPAHKDGVARVNGEAMLHGSWLNKQWQDENGLSYKGTGGTGGNNGKICEGYEPTPEPTPTQEPTQEPTPSPTQEPTPSPTATQEPTQEPTPSPTATQEPTPTETPQTAPYHPATVAKSTSNSTLAFNAIDGDPATSWLTQMQDGAVPTYGWVSVDLGGVKPVEKIAWLWSETGFADDMRVQVSKNGKSWETVASPNNGPAWEWQSIVVDVKARYVRFYFRNPNGDAQLGYLSEVLVYAWSEASPPPDPEPVVTATPAPSIEPGTRLKVVSSKRSSNSRQNSSKASWDGKKSTAWYTEMTTAPKSGWVMFDLAEVKPIGKVQWQFNQLGYADSFKIQVSHDGETWVTVATCKNASAVNTWQTLELKGVEGRYVRFYFSNPNKDPNVGWLSEVRFYA